MDTTTGATATMEDTKAGDYYRRSGFNPRIVRGRPGVKRRANLHQVREWDLDVNDVAEFVVYPELTLRSKPWQFWGKVARFLDETVVLRQMEGEQKGTIVRIPVRYFQDGRVFRKGDFHDESTVD